MFNPLNLITKFIKSSNQKELDRIGKIVEKINSYEEQFIKLSDTDFPKKTVEFKNQLKNGGQLPVWELAGNYTGCMIGYHSVSVIADAYFKGIPFSKSLKHSTS